MSFNKGYELKKFEAHWEKLRIEYAAAGMTEDAIQKMYDYGDDSDYIPYTIKLTRNSQIFSGCFFFIAHIGKNSADGYAPNEDENAQKKLSNIALLYTKYSNRYTHHKTYTV